MGRRYAIIFYMQIKSVIFIVAVIALVGIFNCVVVEPAYAQIHEHHETHEQESDAHNDMMCPFSHHIWNVESHQMLFEQPLIAREFVSYLSDFSPNPPVKGIFHPPAVL